MRFSVVIPARYASTRLPGKPLLDIAGKAMVVRVAERALASAAENVVVATDDARVLDALGATPAAAVMTRDDHPTGSDRVMEVVELQGWADDDVVVNVQGDEPLIPPTVIDQVAGLLRDGSCGVATLYEPITRGEDVFDPNIVKVVVNRFGRAIYFSRAPMPWWRDGFATDVPDIAGRGPGWKRHIGIYAYRVAALREFVHWPPSPLEETEALEQLRLLDHGRAIAVAEAVAPVPGGVDTPGDLERVCGALSSH
ncbi:MAG: 3-deoxy-manno-octulosonate cytidylyltransferase [Gammaproteobacteria bacterium]|nr:3-deoxy-manno-octulosonate cytidylyltransferase [Gammaproteobacteria bacterium]